MNVSEILQRAWQIIWRNKVLWIFGILASCSGGGRSPFSSSSYRYSYQELPDQLKPYFQQFNNLQEPQTALLVAVIALVVLFLALLAILLGTVGRIGLIRGTQQAEQGTAKPAFGELFSGSLPYFWRVLGLGLLLGLIGIVIAAVSIPLIILTCGLGLLLLFAVLIIIEIIQEQASNAIVVDDLRALDGLRRGWELVRANMKPVIVMALVLNIGVGAIGAMILAIPFFIVLLPAFFIIAASNGTSPNIGGGIVLSLLCLAAYLPVFIALAGLLRTYIGSAWTLTYLRLTRQ